MANKILNMGEIATRIRDCFHMSRVCGFTSEKECEYLADKVWRELGRKHGKRWVYSSYMKGYVQGLIDAERHANYAQHLEFCYLKDGVLFSTHKGSKRRNTEEFYSAGKGSELADLPSGHYWRDKDKPYFVGSD